ncbi:MAG: glycosyltransferase family 4 protein [Acidobacteriota bacterium]|nr:glycosyltransferase family 4 protein [Acidobacteriota bacterium]
MSPIIILSFVIAGLSCLGVAMLRRWAERHSVLDIPNKRSSHDRPIPHVGGLAIVTITLLGVVIFWFQDPTWSVAEIFTFVAGGGFVACAGLVDDLYGMSRRLRLLIHGLCAMVVILGIGSWNTVVIPLSGQLDLGWLGVLITFVWITGLTNAYNFMDGMDGLAGGQAVVAGSAWIMLGWLSDQGLVMLVGALLASSCLGFLVHNWPPARIFMGDVGSIFLGYTFAGLSVIGAQRDPTLALSGVLILWPFVFDTSFTLLRRLSRGENIFVAHRSHLYQRLLIVGHTHRFLSLLYITLAAVGAIMAQIFTMGVPTSSFLVVFLVPLMCLVLWAFVIREERKYARSLRPRVPGLDEAG